MDPLAPSYSVKVDTTRRELHFATSGLFDNEAMDAVMAAIAKEVGPLLADGKPIRALGDLTNYVTQTRHIGDRMAKIFEEAEKVGVERTAMIITSSLLSLQYQRLTKGRNIRIFDNRNDALKWLRQHDEIV